MGVVQIIAKQNGGLYTVQSFDGVRKCLGQNLGLFYVDWLRQCISPHVLGFLAPRVVNFGQLAGIRF